MATPEENLDRMLKDFEKKYKPLPFLSNDNPGQQLRKLIDETPNLRESILEQIKGGQLEGAGFEALNTRERPNSLGAYDPDKKTIALPINKLSAAGRDNQLASQLRATLGQEINKAAYTAMPEGKLDKMLDDFQSQHKTTATDPGQQLRKLINETPGLRDSILEHVKEGQFKGFEALDTRGRPNSRGTYDPHEDKKTITVPIDQLNKAAGFDAEAKQIANSLRFTLGHEFQHVADRRALLDNETRFTDRVDAIASYTTSSPHDYTAPLKDLIIGDRELEVRAEIAGFNVLAGYVRKQNPNATLKDLYEASPDMKAYIDFDPNKPLPEAYKPKPGLTITGNNVLTYDKSMGLDSDNSKNLEMPSIQKNEGIMGKVFYERYHYPENNANNFALDYIRDAEAKANERKQNTNAIKSPLIPQVYINFKEADVRVQGSNGVPRGDPSAVDLRLWPGILDSSPRQPPAPTTPNPAPTTPKSVTPAPSAPTPISVQKRSDLQEQPPGETVSDGNRVSRTASASSSGEKPNRFEQSDSGQLLGGFFNGDPKEAADKYKQTSQFDDWDKLAKSNYQQQQGEEKKLAENEQPNHGGFGRA
jgi:hypothetical protein